MEIEIYDIIYLVPDPADELDAEIKGSDRYMCQPGGQEAPPGWRIIIKGIKEISKTERAATLCLKKIDELVEQESKAPVPPEPVKTQPVPDTPKPAELVPEKPAAPDEEAEPETIRIAVTNLSADTTEDALRELFGQFGEVKSGGLETDEDGNSNGTAFVEMPAKAAEAVSALNGSELDGKRIVVKKP